MKLESSILPLTTLEARGAAPPSPSANQSRRPEVPTPHQLDPANWDTNHRTYLLNVALGKVRNQALAEDLVQDTFLAAWKAKNRFQGKAAERTWLTRILLNKIADSYRSSARKPSIAISQLTGEAQSEDDLMDVLFRNENGQNAANLAEPALAAERAELLRLVERCLDNVPEQAATAFRMRELQGLSTKDIADRLNITPNHIWVLIHRAKKSLRKQLEGLWENALEPSLASPAL